MCDVLRFWFDRGVDGFRVDAIHHLLEDAGFDDNPPDPSWREGMPPNERWLQIRTVDQPGIHLKSTFPDSAGRTSFQVSRVPSAMDNEDRSISFYWSATTADRLPTPRELAQSRPQSRQRNVRVGVVFGIPATSPGH